MRFSLVSIGLLAFLTPLASAWSKEDREIFRIRDEIKAHEEPGMTFYDVLGVAPSASLDDITKAYRKKTRTLHPDKVKQQLNAERVQAAKKAAPDSKGKKPTVKPPTPAELKAAIKAAGERQARLSLIKNILRGPERDRYDHFLSNGFPLWKGTDYYYNRYRPGLGTVLVGVFLVGGGAIHYLALYMSWRRQREFVERYIRFARETAWGNNLAIPGVDSASAQQAPSAAPAAAPAAADDENEGPPMPMNRKQRRMQERDSRKDSSKTVKPRRRAAQTGTSSATQEQQQNQASPTGAKKRVVAENGKILVVDSLGDVYLEGQDEDGNIDEFLLDPNEIPQPTFKDTLVVRLPIWLFNSTAGRFLGARNADGSAVNVSHDDTVDGGDDSDAVLHTPGSDSAEDFELLEKSVDSIDTPLATGAEAQASGGKVNKRKNKKK